MKASNLNQDSIKIIAKLYKWRKKLMIITAAAAVISIIVSFVISPQYRGTAIVFPARTFSVAKLLVEQNAGNQEDYMELGDEDDAEKLLQIFNSDDIRELIANEYDLWTHWKVPKDNVYSYHYLKQKWDEMVSFKRTDYVSIRIDVLDYQSDRAAKIANSIVAYADTIKHRMTRQVALQAFEIVEEEYHNYLNNVQELEDSLQRIRMLGIMDFKNETEAYAKAMAKATAKGDVSAMNKLQSKIDLLEKYGMAYLDLQEKLKKYRFKYPVIKGKYDEAYVNVNKHLPSNFVVNKAVRNEKKAKPVRFLIVLISTFSAFLLAFSYLLISERFDEFKTRIKEEANAES